VRRNDPDSHLFGAMSRRRDPRGSLMVGSESCHPTPHKRQPCDPEIVRIAPRSALHDPADVLRSGPSSMPRRSTTDPPPLLAPSWARAPSASLSRAVDQLTVAELSLTGFWAWNWSASGERHSSIAGATPCGLQHCSLNPSVASRPPGLLACGETGCNASPAAARGGARQDAEDDGKPGLCGLVCGHEQEGRWPRISTSMLS